MLMFDETEYEFITTERREYVAWLTINRPEKRNALSPRARAELTDAIAKAGTDRELAAIVITGAGGNFCSGGDFNNERGISPDAPRADQRACYEAMRRSRIPVIAAVRGNAAGSGVPLAYLSDFVLAAEDATFFMPETALGTTPGGFEVAALIHIVGDKRAREMWMSGRRYSAEKAAAMGLVNEVYPVEAFEERVMEYAAEFAYKSPTTVHVMKVSFDSAYDHLRHLRSDYLASKLAPDYIDDPEIREGLPAFKERRRPDFSRWRTARKPDDQ